MSDKVTITDCRRAGFCAKGIRAWFVEKGFDFKDFLENGIDEEKFLATGDARALQAVERKRRRTWA